MLDARHAPGDYSWLPAAPVDQLREGLERALRDPDQARACAGALTHRVLAALRTCSRGELAEEALAVAEALESEAGESLRIADPIGYGRLDGLATLLGAALESRAPHAVDAVLADHPTYAAPLLELLANAPDGLARKQIRERLGVADAQLSRMLGDLEEVDLVRRERAGREVLVLLGQEGWARVSAHAPEPAADRTEVAAARLQ